MPPSYFELTRNEQKELLQGAEYRTPWSTKMLEKDVWIVWTLDALFRQPNAPRYAFKGGTCLSKIYGAIHRFSEDVNITLDPDHPTYIEGLDPIEPGVTKNQLKQRGDRARAKHTEYLALTLVPYLEQRAQQLPEHSRPTIVLEDGDEGRVRVHYPSALEPSPAPPYIAENVLLELGARASTEPSQHANVGTYLGNLPQLEGQVAFPAATVNAMTTSRRPPSRSRAVRKGHGPPLHAVESGTEIVLDALAIVRVPFSTAHAAHPYWEMSWEISRAKAGPMNADETTLEITRIRVQHSVSSMLTTSRPTHDGCLLVCGL